VHCPVSQHIGIFAHLPLWAGLWRLRLALIRRLPLPHVTSTGVRAQGLMAGRLYCAPLVLEGFCAVKAGIAQLALFFITILTGGRGIGNRKRALHTILLRITDRIVWRLRLLPWTRGRRIIKRAPVALLVRTITIVGKQSFIIVQAEVAIVGCVGHGQHEQLIHGKNLRFDLVCIAVLIAGRSGVGGLLV